MNLIVFDLEWNIGYQPKTFLYHGTELTLRGEIIQIGAARINDRGDVLDTFEVNLKPHIFRKLQHHIAKVTGLSQGDLDAGLPMKEGLQKFLDWAGDDAELAEWGLDDVPVLKQNLFLVGLDESWPNRWYDLQRIFLQAYPARRRGPDPGKRCGPPGHPQGRTVPQRTGRRALYGQGLPQAAAGRGPRDLSDGGGAADRGAARCREHGPRCAAVHEPHGTRRLPQRA
ncbi:exonuclease domain-containing protein [Gemmiger formicilis]|nr:exonuclease domain-containing protein [Gemmiger formicilis]